MPSIVIPAHNEEGVIARCLSGILRDARPGEFNVIVVSNGSTDRTVEVARRFGPAITVLELSTPSKTAALNLGDERAERFPRVYLDADAVLSTDGIRALVKALNAGALLAYPRWDGDLSAATTAVRHYYRTWRYLSYERHDLTGVGAYALSASGRARFERFPDVVADDLFVRSLFSNRETTIAESAHAIVRPPATLSTLIHVKTRVFAGNLQHAREFQETDSGTLERQSFASVILRCPHLWVSAPVYAYVQAAAKLRARRRVRAGHAGSWSRDERRGG